MKANGLRTRLAGNIVVDSIAASVYNAALGGEGRMHAFTGAGRALWRRFPALLRAVHALRVAQPLSLAIGRFAAKVQLFCRCASCCRAKSRCRC